MSFGLRAQQPKGGEMTLCGLWSLTALGPPAGVGQDHNQFVVYWLLTLLWPAMQLSGAIDVQQAHQIG